MQDIYQATSEVIVYIPSDLEDQNGPHHETEGVQISDEFFDRDSSLRKGIYDWGLYSTNDQDSQKLLSIIRSESSQSYWNSLWTMQEYFFCQIAYYIERTRKVSMGRFI
jgi:hypothetical protein